MGFFRTVRRKIFSRCYRFSLCINIPLFILLSVWIIGDVILINTKGDAVQNTHEQISDSIRSTAQHSSEVLMSKSDKRGYVALLYSGTARSFSANFESHIVNLMAGCPYTVHLFLHTYAEENPSSRRVNQSNYANYLSVNSTLTYFEGYINLDNERVLFRDAVKANVFEYVPLEKLREMYQDTYRIAIRRFPRHPPIPGIYFMWHSQRRSEELRQDYLDEFEIEYKWTFRMRHDAIYFTNWWQRAFDITVYNPLNATHKNITHDVYSDWGIHRTRLYDMVYEPRLKADNVLYTPTGWSNGGYNDQFAALSSLNANHYFMRILHVDRMLREKSVHPETSIRFIAQWNNMNVDQTSATICYDIVRISTSSQRACSYKKSGEEDCRLLCPKLEQINKVLRENFIHNASLLKSNESINNQQIQELLIQHLSHIKDGAVQIDQHSSSFYYFYRYVSSKNANDPCLPDTWTRDQGNNYATHHLPFILRSSDQAIITMYNQLLTCGSSVNVTI